MRNEGGGEGEDKSDYLKLFCIHENYLVAAHEKCLCEIYVVLERYFMFTFF
jgi:hypothetical protein